MRHVDNSDHISCSGDVLIAGGDTGATMSGDVPSRRSAQALIAGGNTGATTSGDVLIVGGDTGATTSGDVPSRRSAQALITEDPRWEPVLSPFAPLRTVPSLCSGQALSRAKELRVNSAKEHRRYCKGVFSLIGFAIIFCFFPLWSLAQTAGVSPSPCHIESTTFEGWKAEQLANQWVTLTIVPQLGGRLMQVIFGGHPYLFVNPQYVGQYFPPQEGDTSRRWINYGGDKVWPMPEGTKDEQHWAGPVSGPLDDGAYTLRVLSHEPDCAVELLGPPDPQTGLQYSRDIRIGSSSPEIFFHAVMKNVTGHPLRWSMQSVTQYDTADHHEAGAYNHDFWAFTPANPESVYLEGYHVRDGPSGDPSFSIRNGLFALHWLYLQSEVWVDSPGDWVAVVDNSTQYAMIERFHPHPRASYPGKASVIFYTNGPALRLNDQGAPEMTPADPSHVPYYMEAELNSPMADLTPGSAYAMDTEWFPTRLAGPLATVTYAGAVSKPIQAAAAGSKLQLSGTFGVFFPGELIAHFYNRDGMQTEAVWLQAVSPLSLVTLQQEIDAPPETARVSIHLEDQSGLDRGSLGEAWINPVVAGAY